MINTTGTRKQVLLVFFISLILLAVSIILIEQEYFGICIGGHTYTYGEFGNINNPPSIGCGSLLSEGVGQPISMFSVVLIILSLILLIVPQTFHSWFRFAKYYIPIAAVVIAYFPVTAHGLMSFDRELATWFTAGIFFIISIILIVYKWFRGRTGSFQ